MKNDNLKGEIIEACMGLAQHEVHKILSRCYAENDGKLNPKWIREAKSQMIMERFQGALEFVDPEGADVGGNEELMEAAEEARASFSSEVTRSRGIPDPKGFLVVGFPGCGKSLAAKAIARKWGMTLVKLNLAELYSKYVGESEANAKAIQKTLEALAPCIVWIDEIEKGFAGTSGSGDSDGGTSVRVFGSFLTWLQDKKAPVFVVATANNIESLRSELKRKGRFDDIFFVDIPTESEREAITKIHIDRRGSYVAGVDAKAVAKAADGYSGAELEAALGDAMRRCNFLGKDAVTTQDVLDAMARTTPQSVSEAGLLPRLREWATKGNVRRASKVVPPPANPKTEGDSLITRTTMTFDDTKK